MYPGRLSYILGASSQHCWKNLGSILHSLGTLLEHVASSMNTDEMLLKHFIKTEFNKNHFELRCIWKPTWYLFAIIQLGTWLPTSALERSWEYLGQSRQHLGHRGASQGNLRGIFDAFGACWACHCIVPADGHFYANAGMGTFMQTLGWTILCKR